MAEPPARPLAGTSHEFPLPPTIATRARPARETRPHPTDTPYAEGDRVAWWQA